MMDGLLHDAFLAVHVAAGASGLVLGPVAMRAGKRRGVHTTAGELYFAAFAVLFASSLALAALDPARLWWLALIAVWSFALAAVGYRAAKRRRPGWLVAHVSGQGGSYIALVTAFLVVNLGTASPVAWIAPTVIGSPLIAWVNFQIRAGRRPKRPRRSAPQRLEPLEDLGNVPQVRVPVADRVDVEVG